MSDFLLPDLGEGLAEAEVIEWHVGAGDHVVAGQPLVSVETDKSVVEVPSPRSGTIAACHGAPGDLVQVGAPLVTFADDAPGGAAADAGTVVGRLPGAGSRGAGAGAGTGAGSPGVGAGAQDAGSQAPGAGSRGAGSHGAGSHLRAAPAVRALASKLGVDIDGLTPTGPGGTVTSADVEAAAGVSGLSAEPLRGVRRAMAANMARSHREVVPTTVHDFADVGEWVPGTDPTLRLLRAVGAAAAAEPACNTEFLGPDRGLRRHSTVHIGVAVESDDGLFVPVLRDVTRRTAEDLRAGLDRLRADVADRSIPPEELGGATITLSNFGMYGGLYAELVVIPPQVAIVGAGRIHDAVVARDSSPAVRRVLPLSLTIDHRVVTGVESLRFLRVLIADLESSA